MSTGREPGTVGEAFVTVAVVSAVLMIVTGILTCCVRDED